MNKLFTAQDIGVCRMCGEEMKRVIIKTPTHWFPFMAEIWCSNGYGHGMFAGEGKTPEEAIHNAVKSLACWGGLRER